jgi:hypothetical protein
MWCDARSRLLHPLGADEEFVNGVRNRSREQSAKEQCGALDDQEEEAERDQDPEKRLRPDRLVARSRGL